MKNYKEYFKAFFIAICFIGMAFLLEFSARAGSQSYSITNPKLWALFIACVEEGLFILAYAYFRFVVKTDDYFTILFYKLSFIFIENDIKAMQANSIAYFVKNFLTHLLMHLPSLVVASVLISQKIEFLKKEIKFGKAMELGLLACVSIIPHWIYNWSVHFHTLPETRINALYIAGFSGCIGLILFLWTVFYSKEEKVLQ